MASADSTLMSEKWRMEALKEYAQKNGTSLKPYEAILPDFLGTVYRIQMEDGRKLDVTINNVVISAGFDDTKQAIVFEYEPPSRRAVPSQKPYSWRAVSPKEKLCWYVKSGTIDFPNQDPTSDKEAADLMSRGTIRDLIEYQNNSGLTDTDCVDELLELYDAITEIIERDREPKSVVELGKEAGDDMGGVSLPALEQEEPNRI